MSLLLPGFATVPSGISALIVPSATALLSHASAGFASCGQSDIVPTVPRRNAVMTSSSVRATPLRCNQPRLGLRASNGSSAWPRARPIVVRGFAASVAAMPGKEAPASDVVEAVLSCAALGSGTEASTDKGVLAHLASCAAEKAADMSPDQIRNLLMSFAQLKYHSIPFKTAMVDAILAKLDEFEPRALADTAWAFGQAEYYDYELLGQLVKYLHDHADQFDASSMAKLLWLFGRAGYQDAVLMDLMHDIALKLQGAMDTESIAEVMFAEAQLGWGDPRLQGLVADYALDNMQAFDGSSLARMIYGLAAVGYEDEDLYAAVCDRATELLQGMVPADVALVMWAMGQQGQLHRPFLSAVADTYIPINAERLTPQQLQVVVVAFNKLGYSSPGVADAALQLSKVLPELAPEFPDAEETPATAVLKEQ